MAGGKASGKFVYKKISKIRWKPRADTASLGGKLFVTGSWDDRSANEVSLWTSSPDDPTGEPTQLSSVPHVGDVNEIAFLTPETFVTAASTGHVRLWRLVHQSAFQAENSSGWKLLASSAWTELHRTNAKIGNSIGSGLPCNSVSCNGELIVSGGEDGRLFLLNAGRKQAVRSVDAADSCSISAVAFVKHDEFVAANIRGQLKLWDVRSSKDSAAATFATSASGEQGGITCVARHPTQAHILATGSQDGSLAFWDLRSDRRHPATVLGAHQGGAVSEVHFHQQQPDHIFTCSQSGEVLHWNGSNVSRANALNFGNQRPGQQESVLEHQTSSPWLSSEAVKHRLETHSLMSKQLLPVNSISSLGPALLVAGDNEAIYIIPSVIL